ncbi:FadR/GntR family transcriptional regulator [Pseudonocardia nigra]|uniref:FadR/GntR family transcriptional regulator n=1 Tax=Pseudonocardia nigra TaxID=1921578 RepID=UPI001C5EFA68|nr:FCD domain-containing protein [Pseudonocardia nigra]
MRTHELVLARIEGDVAAGRLRLGERLPGERVLAEQLGVSRPSVREAIRVLEALGVIRTATGSGPEAGAVLIADPAAGLGAALRLHVATTGVPVRDVVQLRLLVESWGVREAAVRTGARADGEVLRRTAALLDAMDDPGLAPDRFLDLDGDFHAALVGLAGNVLVTAVMTSLRGAVRDYIGAGARRLTDWPGVARRLRAEHRRIHAAVCEGRADDAEREVRAHIEGYYRDSGVE